MNIEGENMYKVSVIVPVYNGENYISICLDSLVNQTLQELEVIIINDGSTDDTLTVLDYYVRQYPQLFKVYTIKNSGQGIARNIGVSYATGEYLAFADSDDYMAPEMYEQLYKFAKQYSYDLVVCPYYRVSQDHIILNTEMNQMDSITDINTSPWNKLFHRQTWLNHQVKFAEKLWYEDVLAIYSYVFTVKKIGFYQTPMYYYVFRENSSINLYSPKVNDIFKVFNQLYDYLNEKNVIARYREEIEAVFLMHIILGHLSRCVSEKSLLKRHNYIKETKQYITNKFPKYNDNKYMNLRRPLSQNNLLSIVKAISLKAFKYNLFDIVLIAYRITQKLKINVNRW